MSQTKIWTVAKATTTRVRSSSGAAYGSGNSKRLYVGRYGGWDYDSYIQFTQDWTNVGQIVSAVLTVTTDDGLGIMPSTTTEDPHTTVRRLTSAFVEGNAADGVFEANDYTNPSATTSAQVWAGLTRAELGVTNIDVTAIVEMMAPKTVKRRSGAAGGGLTNYGIALIGSNTESRNWAGFSEDYTDPTMRPYITLTYELGKTIPNTPSNLDPSGAEAGVDSFFGDFSDPRPTDTLAFSEVEVYKADGTTLVYQGRHPATSVEKINARFQHIPDNLNLVRNTTYKWRARVTDQEGQTSAWTALTSFSVSNTQPDAPSNVQPTTASSFATLDGVQFGGSFTDPDAGDYLLAYEVQFSAFPEGASEWLDDENILWNTGKRYVLTARPDLLPRPGGVVAPTRYRTPYGGSSLTAGTYYWRTRVWDQHQGLSNWVYSSIVVTEDYVAHPDGTQTAIQLRPRAPWRIVIKDMYQSNGITRTVGRGPGRVVAVIEDAANVGASTLYNSPGELHFTLRKDHPQISVIEAKQTHYSVQFRQGDGWREVFAGLMWDWDATDQDVVFYGIDYLSLYDLVADERYDPSNPDKPSESGGSKYVTAGHNSISYIISDQIDRAKALTNSPVGFITRGSIASMAETLVVYSTYQKCLSFCVGLMDSHRAGTGKKTRMSVRQAAGGGYEVVVEDDPGTTRDNLRMRYGELVQGYRVIPFGQDWASRISSVGRSKDGIKVMYKTATTPGIDESVWGRYTQLQLIDGVSDENDQMRRTKQAAVHAGKLGKSIGLGLRTGVLQPFDGWNICDAFPVDIEDGAVSTAAFGSGYWIAVGVTWTVEAKTNKQATIITFSPREDAVAPDTDLLQLHAISPQAIWQIGWVPPDASDSVRRIFLSMDTGLTMDSGVLMDDWYTTKTGPIYMDLSTGNIYEFDGVTWNLISSPGTVAAPTPSLASREDINSAGIAVTNVRIVLS